MVATRSRHNRPLDQHRFAVAEHLNVVADAVADDSALTDFVDVLAEGVAASTELATLDEAGVDVTANVSLMSHHLIGGHGNQDSTTSLAAAANAWQQTVAWLADRASVTAVLHTENAHRAYTSESMTVAVQASEMAAALLSEEERLERALGTQPERAPATCRRDWTHLNNNAVAGWQVMQLRWPDDTVYVMRSGKSVRGAVRTAAQSTPRVRQKLELDPATPVVRGLKQFIDKQAAHEYQFRTLRRLHRSGIPLLNGTSKLWLASSEPGRKRCRLCRQTMRVTQFPFAHDKPGGRRANCQYCHRLEQRYVRQSVRTTGSGAAGYRALKQAVNENRMLSREPAAVIAKKVADLFPSYDTQR